MTTLSSSSGVWFPQWAEILARARLKDIERRTYRLAIGQFLLFCRRSRQRATVASARAFMAEVQTRRRLGVSQTAAWKEGVNWFFSEAKRTNPQKVAGPSALPKPVARSKEPPLAATDLGGPDWERALIRRLRAGNYQWRTEETYWGWIVRYLKFHRRREESNVQPEKRGAHGVTRPTRWVWRHPREMGAAEVREFLVHLAVERHIAEAIQNQALNALVFLSRDEGLRLRVHPVR